MTLPNLSSNSISQLLIHATTPSSLIDSEWQFSDGSPVALIKTIWWGVPNQGMPSWAKILNPDEFKALGAYLYTLQTGAQKHE